MLRKMKRIVCVVLCMMVLLSTTGMVVSAAETTVQPRLTYTNYAVTALDITTNGVAYCTAYAEGHTQLATKVHIKMILQKHTVLWWSNQETWEGTFNTSYGALSETASVKKGTYRVKAIYTVYSGSASEEIEAFSQEKTYNG